MVTPILVFDATHDNIGALPKGAQVAGYTTGAGTHIRWTDADFAAHPGAVRIDQDPLASDPTADALDIEAGAATPASAPGWVRRALASRISQTRPGQRSPAVYMSQSRVAEVVNVLTGGGIGSGVGLWIAHFGLTQAQATQMVLTGGGPFPVIGVQFRNTPAFDVSVFSSGWLATGGQQPPTVPAWETAMMNVLPTLQQGAQDRPGQVFFVRRVQALANVIGTVNNLPPAANLAEDGTFGPATTAAVKAVQQMFGIAQDGIVGPQTWSVLVTGSIP
jgi:peptidoglycan hydrolase-like protein with peptidoglycan-binding domain